MSIIKPTGKKGSIVFLIMIATFLILGILAFSLHSNMSEKNNQVFSHSHSMLMNLGSREIADRVFNELGRKLADPQSTLFAKVVKAGVDSFPVNIADEISQDFAFLNSENGPAISLSNFTLALQSPRQLAPDFWRDPLEKTFQIGLHFELTTGRGLWSNMRKSYRFVRDAKCACLSVPVLSRFSLFIKQPEETNEIVKGYNGLRNRSDGAILSPDDTINGVEAPLIVYNSSKASSLDLKKNGMIFLGGDNIVELHLTSGSDVNAGEVFHFYPGNISEKAFPKFLLKNLPAGFSSGISFNDGARTAALKIQATYGGFYDQDTKGNNMNPFGALDSFFAGDPPRTMNSSFLHLSGTMGNPSPGIVIGQILRVFPYYSAIVVDFENDEVIDGLLFLLMSPVEYSVAGKAVNFWDLLPLPGIFSPNSGGESLQIDSGLTLETLFGSRETYSSYACQLITEPYNQVFDYLLNQEMTIPPARRFAEQSGIAESAGSSDYLVSGKNFKFKFPDAEPSESLNLHELNAEKLFSGRFTETYKSSEDFFRDNLADDVLDLRGQTIFVDCESLELPTSLKVRSPGIICCKKNITINGGIPKPEIDGPVSLISLTGDIILETVNEPIYASLIALKGTVKAPESSSVRISGTVAVNTLQPSNWRKGGSITFADYFDPTIQENQNQRHGLYSVIFSDSYAEWGQETIK